MDNFQGAQRTPLSTAEPGTPLVSVGRLRGEQTRRNRTDSSLTNLMESTLTPLSGCPKDGGHLCVAVAGFEWRTIFGCLIACRVPATHDSGLLWFAETFDTDDLHIHTSPV